MDEYEQWLDRLREWNAKLNPLGVEVVYSGPALLYREIPPQPPKRFLKNGDGRIIDLLTGEITGSVDNLGAPATQDPPAPPVMPETHEEE